MTSADTGPPNPFAVKDLPESKGALRPWEIEEHDELYLAVDHTQEAYDRFCEFLADPPRDLVATARVVVVTGGRGSGKTSLINRCVRHIQRALGDQLKIVDVTRSKQLASPPAEGQRDHDPQLDSYLDRLAHLVHTRIAGQDDRFTRPDSTPAPAASIYADLSGQLRRERLVAAVLLPAFLDQVSSRGEQPAPTLGNRVWPEVVEHPVQHYVDFRDRRIVFFAESRDPEAVSAWHEQLDEDARAEVLVLRLGPLKPDDGWTFADGRLSDHRKDTRVPKVSEHIMRNLLADGRLVTLSLLQRLCFDLWRDAIRQGRLEVSDDDVIRLYESLSDSMPLRRPRPGRLARLGGEPATDAEPGREGGGVEAGDESNGQ